MLGDLIELIWHVWRADSKIRDRSLIGASDCDKQSRRFVAWLCGGLIVVVALAGFAWWLLTR